MKRVCECCREAFTSADAKTNVCSGCVSKVTRSLQAKSVGKAGYAPTMKQCPECKAEGKRVVLGKTELREHRYKVHGFHWGLKRVVKRNKRTTGIDTAGV